MIKQNQEFPHDPDNGVYGDCFRAVLASLLEKDISEVPHFLYDNCNSETFNSRVSEYLGSLGLFYMSVPAYDIKSWKESCGITEPIFHEICDISPRFSDTFHATVGCDGEVIHDPHPTKMGLPEITSTRTFGFLVKLN